MPFFTVNQILKIFWTEWKNNNYFKETIIKVLYDSFNATRPNSLD